MEERESLREAENLRFRFQMNNRLRLESLAAVSRVFREFGEPISDDLLSSLIGSPNSRNTLDTAANDSSRKRLFI